MDPQPLHPGQRIEHTDCENSLLLGLPRAVEPKRLARHAKMHAQRGKLSARACDSQAALVPSTAMATGSIGIGSSLSLDKIQFSQGAMAPKQKNSLPSAVVAPGRLFLFLAAGLVAAATVQPRYKQITGAIATG
jgi:hypothetical protein